MAPSVLVVGFGAVGITYSYVLSQGGAEVTGIARSAYATFAEKGENPSSKDKLKLTYFARRNYRFAKREVWQCGFQAVSTSQGCQSC